MIIRKIHDTDLNDEQIWQRVLTIYNAHKHILFFIDSTLDESFLSDFILTLREENLCYLAVAKNNRKNFIYILRLEELDQLENIKDELIFTLKQNFNSDNDRYIICGYGASQYNLTTLSRRIKKTMLLNDLGKEILFRWFDPRVLIYLNDILGDGRMLSILSLFQYWTFYHVSGIYDFEQEYIEETKIQRMKINEDESVELGLIEISNLAYQQGFKLKQKKLNEIEPASIFKELRTAYRKYQIMNNIDLISYALYTLVIHPNFMQHSTVIKTLEKHWIERQEPESFMDAMNTLTEDKWQEIRKELLA